KPLKFWGHCESVGAMAGETSKVLHHLFSRFCRRTFRGRFARHSTEPRLILIWCLYIDPTHHFGMLVTTILSTEKVILSRKCGGKPLCRITHGYHIVFHPKLRYKHVMDHVLRDHQ